VIPDKVFNEGMKLIEKNFKTIFPLSWQLKVWELFKKVDSKKMTESLFGTIVENILLLKYPPRYADFVREIHESQYGKEQSFIMICCRNCQRQFMPTNFEQHDREWCPTCIAWRKTPEGQAEMKRRIVNLRAKTEKMLKTDAEEKSRELRKLAQDSLATHDEEHMRRS